MSADHRVSRARATRTLYLQLDRHGDTLRVCLRGDWTVEHLAQLERALRDITPRDCHSVEFAGGDVAALDLSGAWLLLRTSRLLTERGLRTEFSGPGGRLPQRATHRGQCQHPRGGSGRLRRGPGCSGGRGDRRDAAATRRGCRELSPPCRNCRCENCDSRHGSGDANPYY